LARRRGARQERQAAEIGFVDGSKGILPAGLAAMPKRGTGQTAFSALRPGAIIAVKQEGSLGLRPRRRVRGWSRSRSARAASSHAGRVRRRGSNFNRGHPGMRQPGSTFKPIVYAAALAGRRHDPALDHQDAPFCTNDGTASASATSRAAMPGRRPCAGALSNRAT
jgi:penicillin-binding protein 1A